MSERFAVSAQASPSEANTMPLDKINTMHYMTHWLCWSRAEKNEHLL